MMMMYDRSLSEVLRAFSDPEPTPAAGAAAALSGALGASLLAMIAGLPRMRDDAPEDARVAMDAARASLLGHQEKLLRLVDRDAEAWGAVVSAGADRAARQQPLVAATEVLIDIVRTCTAALVDAKPVGEYGDPSALTDLVGGVNGLATGVQSAWLTAVANTDDLDDDEVTQRLLADIKAEMTSGYPHLPSLYRTSGVVQLLMRASERTGLPHHGPADPQQRIPMLARGVATGLRHLGTPEARAALEALDRSDDPQVTAVTKEMLAAWPM